MTPWQRLLRYGGGATAIECGLIVALMALIAIAALRGVGMRLPPGFTGLQ